MGACGRCETLTGSTSYKYRRDRRFGRRFTAIDHTNFRDIVTRWNEKSADRTGRRQAGDDACLLCAESTGKKEDIVIIPIDRSKEIYYEFSSVVRARPLTSSKQLSKYRSWYISAVVFGGKQKRGRALTEKIIVRCRSLRQLRIQG